jgi:hypothetical protein
VAFRPRSGFLPSVILSLAVLLGTAGCRPYGFSGGGLPPQIRSVAILPFDNLTAEPTLSQDVGDRVREAVEGRLGLRPRPEAEADALVRGSITRYEPDLPVAYTGSDQDNRVEVQRRLVQITVSLEIVDQRQNRTLWERRGLTVEGDYEPDDGESEGRRRALDKLVTAIVDGAQSQW